MKKLLPFLMLFSAFHTALGQAAGVTSLRFNPALYYSTPRENPRPPQSQLKYLVSNGNIIVSTGTPFSLADSDFVDDFSRKRTPYYQFPGDSIYDTLYNVIGPCLGPENITRIEAAFSPTPTYHYYWDTVYQELDSTAIAPTIFSYVLPNTFQCITNTIQYSEAYWPIGYTYTFDSVAGFIIDSLPATPPANAVTLTYAPVLYFAKAYNQGTLWFDNYAYINNTLPINPPTIGVATLDGLNQYGLPYNSATGTGGPADYLTSEQIDMHTLDTSNAVYLSFFYEPGGQGDYPGLGDSLILEFFDQGGYWQQIWADSGYVDSFPDSFQQVILAIPETSDSGYSFFYPGFQFRFRNVVTLYGLNNMWHIDYVRLGKGRSASDTAIEDMAFQFPFPTVLKNFTLEPGPQINFPSDLADSILLPVRNLQPGAPSNPPSTPYVDSANELYPLSTFVSAPPSLSFDARPYDTLHIYPSSDYMNLPSSPVDSMALNSQIFIEPSSNDLLTINDTIRNIQIFSNILAYDDGSAEKAFGLSGGDDVKKFAYEFILNRPDTLVGFQILYTQAEANVGDLVYDIDLWDTLQLNNFAFIDTPILTFVNQLPYYIDSTSGYTTYLLDTDIIVQNKIYLGWDQTDSRRLQVGYDMNDTFGHPHMFTYFNGKWDSAYMQPIGSPMIRLIFGHYYGTSSIPTAVQQLAPPQDQLDIFPNPTGGLVYLRSARANAFFAVDVYNSMGQKVLSQAMVGGQLNLNGLANAVYLLNVRDLQTGELSHKLVVKTAPQ